MEILRYIYIPRATIAIIIFNIICFIYEIPPCKAFRHISVDHLNSNMAFLLLFGGYVESKVGWKGFAVCYLLSGLGGHILWNLMDGRPSAGSSSAVWGIIGMYVCVYSYPDVSTTTDKPVGLSIAEFIILLYGVGGKWIMASAFLYDLYHAIYPTDNLAAYWSHVGGFLTGAIFSLNWIRFYRPWRNRQTGGWNSPGPLVNAQGNDAKRFRCSFLIESGIRKM